MYGRRKVLVFILLMAFCLLVLSACGGEDFSLPPQRAEDFTLRLMAGDEVLAVVTLDEIKAMPSKRKNMVTQSSSLGTLNNEFEGVQLSDIIKSVDESILKDYTMLTAYGADGYFSQVMMAEVLDYSNVFIMYKNHDKLMETLVGDEGSMRIVVCNDPFGQRFTNYLVDIVFEK